LKLFKEKHLTWPVADRSSHRFRAGPPDKCNGG